MDANLALRQFHVYPNILSTASLMDSGLSTLFFTLDQVYLSVTVSKLDILNCHPLIICIRVNLFLNMHSPSFRLHVSRHYSPANSRWPSSVILMELSNTFVKFTRLYTTCVCLTCFCQTCQFVPPMPPLKYHVLGYNFSVQAIWINASLL